MWNRESSFGCDDGAWGLLAPGMRQDGQGVGIGLDPVGTDDDFGAISQPVAGDLGDDAVGEANADLDRPDEIALPDPEGGCRLVLGGGGPPARPPPCGGPPGGGPGPGPPPPPGGRAPRRRAPPGGAW